MIRLTKLLTKSSDFLIVIDRAGNCLEIGNHFKNILELQNVSVKAFKNTLRLALSKAAENNRITLPLEEYNIFSSAFSLLGQDTEKIVLIAEDLSTNNSLQQLKKQTWQIEQQHKEKDRRIHTLLDESSDPVFSFREDGTYLYVNKIFAHTLGYEQEDVIGKKIWDIFHEDEANKRFAMVRKVFITGKTENIEVKLPLPDGDKYYLTTVKPVKNDNDQVDFVICISKNVTELREAQDHLYILQGVIPICATCKKIRNDKGAWQQLEEYISSHSKAEFSHGMCPDCAQNLYPQIFK